MHYGVGPYGVGAYGVGGTTTPPVETGQWELWNGSVWVPATPERWGGAAWEDGATEWWDGTQWQPGEPAPQLPTFVGATVYGSDATELTSAPAIPAGVQPGDLLILAWLVTDSSPTVTVTPTLPGWTVVTPLENQPSSTNQRGLWTRIYQAGDPNPSFTTNLYRRAGWALVAYRGVNPTTPLADVAFAYATGASSQNAPSLTLDRERLCTTLVVRKDIESTAVTHPSGTTVRGTYVGPPNLGSGPRSGAADYIAPAGATGAKTWGFTAATVNGTAWNIALNPA